MVKEYVPTQIGYPNTSKVILKKELSIYNHLKKKREAAEAAVFRYREYPVGSRPTSILE